MINLTVPDLGQEAWLRYRPLAPAPAEIGPAVAAEGFRGDDPVIQSAASEWSRAWSALNPSAAPGATGLRLACDASLAPEESRLDMPPGGGAVISASAPAGALYGVFRLIMALRLGEAAPGWACRHAPAVASRVWMHFDNVWPKVDIERGYGGESLWPWPALPEDPGGRIGAYARLLASAGINAVILNNVNAGEPRIGGWRLVTDAWIPKVAALAALLRPWGIRAGLCIAYNAPELAGDLASSDPRDPAVRDWWRARAAALYGAIPDFLGWVVKADSEGQAGPIQLGLDHAEGSRHLAAALEPHGGLLFWRCFVYGHEQADITAQPYRQFVPLDGRFPENVRLLIKNGPRDYQVREPLHPLFGAMPRTACALELQATQEYLGHDTHAVFLPSQWEQVLALPEQSGAPLRDWLAAQPRTAVVGVANTSDSPCWTGHLFAQANWFGFGRLAWDPSASAEQIAREWAALTFGGPGTAAARAAETILLESYRAFEDYTAPFCLGQVYNAASTWDADHYDPEPWRNNGRDWFYAGPDGAGIPRAQGPHFAQYPRAFRERVADPAGCDEDYLLWFHRVPWSRRMKNGQTLLDALRGRYARGAAQVDRWIGIWAELHDKMDPFRFTHVLERLLRQRLHARLWARYMTTYLEQQAGQETGTA